MMNKEFAQIVNKREGALKYGRGDRFVDKLKKLELTAIKEQYSERIVNMIRRAIKYNYKNEPFLELEDSYLSIYDGSLLILKVKVK